MNTENALISRDAAKAAGLNYYYTGKPCKHGHFSKRFVRSTHCHACDLVRGARNRAKPHYRAVQRRAAARWEKENREHVRAQRLTRHMANPITRIYTNLKASAKYKGREFNLERSDLSAPEYCPALGIKLNYSYQGKGGAALWDSPSVDRIDSSKGYIKGNVIVVSMLANAIKQNATPEQILAVGEFYANLQKTAAG